MALIILGGKNVRVEFKFDKKDFVDMIKKMAVPLSDRRESFLYPTIYPMFIPENKEKHNNAMFEWIIKSEVTTWVRVSYERNTGLTESFRIPINVANTLRALALKAFKERDEVFFIHDSDRGIQIITDGVRDVQNVIDSVRHKSTRYEMPITGEQPESNVYEGLPVEHDPDTEVIMFKGGTLKPDISGSCDTESLKELFADTKTVNSDKVKAINNVYHFKINEDLRSIEAFTDKKDTKSDSVMYKTCIASDIKGHGELHYSSLLEEVIGVLSSDPFKFYTIDCGPLWIMQNTDKTKVRYLVPPAARSK